VDFSDVIRRQRMTRRFEQRPIDRALLESILSSAQKAPSAGYSQGVSLVVLEDARTGVFWHCVDPLGRHAVETRPPVIVVPGYNKQAYLDRYAEPDKIVSGLNIEDKWPTPFWIVDASFAAMTVMLAATAAGLGCWFFGIFTGKRDLLRELALEDFEPIGAIGLGFPAEQQLRSPSLHRGRKPFDEFAIRP
jgi:nitroreductase